MSLYICVPMTFLTWRGRVHAIVYLCSNYFFNFAWTRPCHCWHVAKSKKSRQVKKVIDCGLDMSVTSALKNYLFIVSFHIGVDLSKPTIIMFAKYS
jgi:hypothetical protein